jgi:hypothetical protein
MTHKVVISREKQSQRELLGKNEELEEEWGRRSKTKLALKL